MVYVVLQFDTEDFITPETDNVLLELAHILDQFGVKASFCIVDEKAKVLEKRRRFDVIDVLKRHDIAYQSHLHSVHPVISEYLKDAEWDDGVEEIKKREGPGLENLKRIFGMKPSAFIQPGGSWAPETPYAFKELGIPVYADGIFPSKPVWFCGNLCLSAAMHFNEHSTLADLDLLKSKFDEIYGIQSSGGLIVVILHPCMFITETFWDSVNFAYGKNPSREELTPPPLRSKEEYEESLQTFEEFVGFILKHRNLKVLTFRDVPKLYYKPEERRLRLDQVFILAKKIAIHNDWQIVNKVSVSPAETLRLLVDLIVDHLQKNIKPESVPVNFTLGPTSKPPSLNSKKVLELNDLLALCSSAKDFMKHYEKVPAALREDGVDYGPGDLLEATAKAVIFYSKCGHLPERIEVKGLPSIPEVEKRWNLIEKVKAQWKWVIFPRNFESRRLEDLTLWQSWTIRPAIYTKKSRI